MELRIHRIASARLYGSAGELKGAFSSRNVNDFAYYFLDLTVGTPPQRVSVIARASSFGPLKDL